MSQNLINSLSLSGGFFAYSLIILLVILILTIKSFKDFAAIFGFALVVVFLTGAFHYNNRSKLHAWIKENTCDRMSIDKNKNCEVTTVPFMGEVAIIVSQNNELSLDEKFYYLLEKQPVKKVSFIVAENCNKLFFCKYSYEPFIYEFDLNKTRINEYLNSNQDQRIYFR